MSELYNALTKKTDSSRNGTMPAAPAAFALQGVKGGEMETLRAILIGNLPEMIREALERLTARVAEQSAAFRGELDELERRLEKRIADIEQRANASRNELRDQILSQSKLLSDSIQERSDHAIQVSMKGVTELRQVKLDRNAFADFLRHTAEHFAGSIESEGHSAAAK
jgi:hypothetical protein